MRHFWHSLRSSFFTGLFLVLPLVVTVFILYQGFLILTSVSRPLMQGIFAHWGVRMPPELVSLSSFLLTVAALVLLGFAGRSFLGRQALRAFEGLMVRIPLAKTLYVSTRKLLDTFTLQKDFQRVVLVEYPRKGVFCMGFQTGLHRGYLETGGDRFVNVFLPTTPNPTSGYLVILPEKEVASLAMTVEEGVTFVISGGIVSPEMRLREAGAP